MNEPFKCVLPSLPTSMSDEHLISWIDEVKHLFFKPIWNHPSFIHIHISIYYSFFNDDWTPRDLDVLRLASALNGIIRDRIGKYMIKSFGYESINCANDEFIFVEVSTYEIKQPQIAH